MTDLSRTDLEDVRAKLTAWRSTKKGHPRIPEPIWRDIVALADLYPLDVLCRELKLKAAFFRKRLARTSPTHPSASPFLEISPAPLPLPASPLTLSPRAAPDPPYRLQIERPDGARLSLHLPAKDAASLQALVLAFARA